MDSLTHTVLGACMGEAIAGKKIGKKAMLLGALANNLPDIDVVSKFWTLPAESLLVHRGITHSILAAILFTLLLAWLFNRTGRSPDMSYRRWLLLFGSNIFTHLLIDAFTAYGTGWFEPFSHARVSFNTLFILDPFFLLPLLVTCIILLVLKRHSPRRSRVLKVGLFISLFYIACTWINKACVNSVVKDNLAAQNIVCDDYMSTPTALNNFLWFVVAKSDTGHYIGYYSVFDKDKTIHFDRVSKNDSLLRPFDPSEEIDRLRRFSKGYYHVLKNGDTTVFCDMRFGQIDVLDYSSPFVFRFDLSRDARNATSLQQGRFKASGPEAIKKLVKRISGKE